MPRELFHGERERLITLNVNGQQWRVDVMKEETFVVHAALQVGPYWHQAGMRSR
jgi:hypothetical protein